MPKITLSREMVIAIKEDLRSEAFTGREIAARRGVSYGTVCAVKSGDIHPDDRPLAVDIARAAATPPAVCPRCRRPGIMHGPQCIGCDARDWADARGIFVLPLYGHDRPGADMRREFSRAVEG